MIQQEMSYFLELVMEMSDEPAQVIEQLASQEILTHRRLYSEAEVLFDELQSGEKGPAALIAYLSKIFAAMAQQEALSLMIDKLGFVPIVPTEKMN